MHIRPRLSHSNSFGNDAEKDTAGCHALNRKFIVIGGAGWEDGANNTSGKGRRRQDGTDVVRMRYTAEKLDAMIDSIIQGIFSRVRSLIRKDVVNAFVSNNLNAKKLVSMRIQAFFLFYDEIGISVPSQTLPKGAFRVNAPFWVPRAQVSTETVRPSASLAV